MGVAVSDQKLSQLDQFFAKQLEILQQQLELLKDARNPSVAPSALRANPITQESLEQRASASIAPQVEIKAPVAEAKPSGKIAVVGMAGRYPGARNIREFWNNLMEGRESISHFSLEEIDHAVPAEDRFHPNYGRSRGVLEDADKFDAEFFRISPREAKLIDPQQRIFLEVAYEALQDAGYDPDQFPGEIGVYGGVGDNFYHIHNVLDKKDLIKKVGQLPTTVGNMKDYVATRVSYKLNLTGPSISVNTACSTSLVAIDQAVWSLRNGNCAMALAGAASLYVPQKAGFMHGPGLPFSSDGHIRPFSSDATGVMFSDGVGIVVLKRLEDALAAGDHIYGLIIGSALNNDGMDKMSFFAPSSSGQTRVIRKALKDAAVSADSLSFVEAHATGTMLGDPVEFEGLKAAFAEDSQRKNFCAIGAYKANIGHTDAAAGVTGLIKALLSIEARKLPPNINFKTPNPAIEIEDSPFFIPTRPLALDNSRGPIRAGISAFGFGGTNSHVIVEEAPQQKAETSIRSQQLLLLSADSPAALERSLADFARYFRNNRASRLADTAYTLAKGRKAFAFRRFVSAQNTDDAADKLQALLGGESQERGEEASVAFMFPGQGIQTVNMARELYDMEPIFRAELDNCALRLQPLLGLDIRELLYPAASQDPASSKLDETRYAQPAIFCVEYALARTFIALGVKPAALIGHSLGELVCATVAEVFSLDDALKLITQRGRLMQGMQAGKMLSVNLSESELKPYIKATLQIAAVNGPKQCVMAGDPADVDALEALMRAANITCRALRTSHAFHSHTVDPIMGEFAALFRDITIREATIPFISTLTGDWIRRDQVLSPAYWTEHMRAPVRFFDGIRRLWSERNYLLLEVGPRDTASTLARKAAPNPRDYKAIASLNGENPYQSFQTALGQLWAEGLAINWDLYYAHEKRQRLPLPTYSFEKVSHWLDSKAADAPDVVAAYEAKFVKSAAASEVKAPIAEVKASVDVTPAKAPIAEVKAPVVDVAPATANVDVAPATANVDVAPDKAPSMVSLKTSLGAALKSRLKAIFEEASGIQIASHSDRFSFLELGFDSLTLTQICAMIAKEYAVDIPYTRLVKDLNTIEKVQRFLQETNLAPASTKPAIKALGLKTSEASYSQLRMWMHDQMKPGSTTYNIPIYFEIRGALDSPTLQKTLAHMVQKHEVLRSVYRLEGRSLMQKVQDAMPLAFDSFDLSHLPSESVEAEITKLLQTHGRRPLDLDKGPIIRFALIRVNPDRHVFLLNAHHIAFDLLSIRLFLNEMSQSYSAAIAGQGFGSETPALQFSDFAVWQRQWMESGEKDRQIAHWVKHLGFAPVPVLQIPVDFARPAMQPEFDSVEIMRFARSPIEDLLNLAKSEGASPFIALLSAYKCMLMLLSGQRDLVIGTPIASRGLPEAQNMIGFFANTLALRTKVEETQSFRDILRGVRDNMLAGFDNQEAPLDEIVRKLQVNRDPSFHTLFQTFFSFEKMGQDLYRLGDAAMKFSGDVSRAAPATDINLWIEEHADHLRLDIEYSSQLFKKSRIASMFETYEKVLRILAKNPEMTLSGLQKALENAAARTIEVKVESPAAPANKGTKEKSDLFIAICRDILGLERIDLGQSFQHHGGHSMLALAFRERLAQAFPGEISLKDLLKAKTLRAILEAVSTESEEETKAEATHDIAVLDARELPQAIAAQVAAVAPYRRPDYATIHELVAAAAKRDPQKIAVRYKSKTLTFAELDAQSNQMAHYLRAQGVREGQCVGISMNRSLDLIVGMLGILKAGAAYLPMDPAYPNDRLQYMAENSGIQLIVSEEEYVDTLAMPADIRLVAMDEERPAIAKSPRQAPELNLAPDSLAYVIYTSGSTGKPKGVEIPHASATVFLESMQAALSFKASDVLMGLTTISFDISVLEIFMTLGAGATLVLMDTEDALDGKKLAQTLEQHQVSFFQATPSGWRILLDGPWAGSQRVTGLCGGEAFPRDLAERLLPKLGAIYNVYGPTEATVWATYNRLERVEDNKIIGRALDGYRIYILNGDFQDARGEIGDLYIGGAALARGYMNRPDLTAERFIANPFVPGERMYNTGDRARFLPDGRIEYISRADDQVKIRGYRIELGEIEAVANKFMAVKLSAAVVHEFAPGDQRIVLFVQPRSAVDQAQLKAFMRESLPDYFLPNMIRIVDAIPLTANGKIDRKTLKASCETVEAPQESLETAASTEEWLIQLWTRHLQQAKISKSNNFFEMGGYSLLGIIVAAEITAKSGKQVTLTDLLSSTLEQLALRIDQASEEQRA